MMYLSVEWMLFYVTALGLVSAAIVAFFQVRGHNRRAHADELARAQLEKHRREEAERIQVRWQVWLGHGVGEYKFHVFNHGPAPAFDILVEFLDCPATILWANDGVKHHSKELHPQQQSQILVRYDPRNPRSFDLRVSWMDLDGGRHTEDFKGVTAR